MNCVSFRARVDAVAAAGRRRLRRRRRRRSPAGPAKPTAHGAKAASPTTEPPKYEETVVVSASRTEEKVINAPATMSVITAADDRAGADAELRRAAALRSRAQHHADLRARHQRHERGATGTLATGQLALLDGRSLYQDFFGFVMWDFLPVNLNEIKQIEVIRGPASAVWGANALNGVVNVITKSPREMQGTSVTSARRRSTARRMTATPTAARSCTSAARTRRRSTIAGRTRSRPAATPRIRCRDRPGRFPDRPVTRRIPTFTNKGTTQPKFDGRVDYDFENGKRLSFSGGFAGTEGIMHTGIGPFDIDNGSTMGYGR